MLITMFLDGESMEGYTVGFWVKEVRVLKQARVYAILSKNVISWLTHSSEGRMTAIYLRFVWRFYSVASGNTEILRLKRRFLKEKSTNSDYFAKQMARRNTMREVN